MPEERLSFERITQIYREEKSKKGLVPLPQDFFIKLGEYINELQDKCQEEEKQGPHTPKGIILRDELNKAIKKRDEIWKIRMRKLVTLASSKLMGASVDKTPFTKEELKIYNNVINILEAGSNEIFTGKKTESVPEAKKEEVPKPGPAKQEEPVKIESPKPVKEPMPTFGTKDDLKDQLTIHILEDLPPMAGKEKNYMLKKNDVVTLPKEIASVLVKKKKAKRIDIAV